MVNLHSIVAPVIAAINPMTAVIVQISSGPSARAPDGTSTPTYQTPGAFTGSIASGILTVSAVAQGVLAAGQTIAGAGVGPNTSIAEQLSGSPGGAGTYEINGSQGLTIAPEAMTTSYAVLAQVQALSGRDLRQIEGLNLQGTLRAIYINGSLDGIVRPTLKGGDLVTLPDGSVWLVTLVLEPWNLSAGWTKSILTLQNGA